MNRVIIFCLSIFMFGSSVEAQEKNLFKYQVLTKIEGPYTYDADGAPILGWIIERVTEERVKFLTCSAKTTEVELKQLKKATGNCPRGRYGPVPWYVSKDELVPVMTTADDIRPMTNGSIKKVTISTLPALLQASVRGVKSGEPAGISFVDEKGMVTLGIIVP